MPFTKKKLCQPIKNCIKLSMSQKAPVYCPTHQSLPAQKKSSIFCWIFSTKCLIFCKNFWILQWKFSINLIRVPSWTFMPWDNLAPGCFEPWTPLIDVILSYFCVQYCFLHCRNSQARFRRVKCVPTDTLSLLDGQ